MVKLDGNKVEVINRCVQLHRRGDGGSFGRGEG
jgi:hypothetical protein